MFVSKIFYYRYAGLIAAGMLASCLPGHAADHLPVYKARPGPQAALPFSWTGFYVGGHFAGASGGKGWADPTDTFANSSFPTRGPVDGILGGAQVGYNYQIGALVAGVAGEFSWGKLDGNANCGQNGSALVCNSETSSMATVTGRLGYAWHRTLFYAKGGIAWSRDKYYAASPSINALVWQNSEIRAGWIVGGGIEYALSHNWSIFGEYDYIKFGAKTIDLKNAAGDFPATIDTRLHVGKIGLNYKFAAFDGAGAAHAEAAGAFARAPAPLASDSQLDVGARYWFSSGKSESNLYDNVNQSQHNSTLIYKSLLAHSGEAFGRFEHISGTFVKGYLGAGLIPGGKLNDEDYPPLSTPYSNTEHDQRNGSLFYGNLDLGYTFFKRPNAKVGAFVGYHYFKDRLHAYGCTQVAPGGDACPSTQSSPALGLSETEQWQSVRVGLSGEIMLTDRLTLSGEAAYLPYVLFNGADNHWFRPNINPLPQIAYQKNYGVQLEAILSYLLTDRFSVGIGGRYWFMQAQGHTQFPDGVPASPEHYTTQRYGVFVQTSYKLAGP